MAVIGGKRAATNGAEYDVVLGVVVGFSRRWWLLLLLLELRLQSLKMESVENK